MTPILRRDGSTQSADSAGKIKASAVATNKSSIHSRGAEGRVSRGNPWVPHTRRSTLVPRHSLHSYFQSGSSGCFTSHSGRRLRTSGRVSKLYSGGGEDVDHSSVHASHGSLPAMSPRVSDRRRLITKQNTPAAWNKAPIEEIIL